MNKLKRIIKGMKELTPAQQLYAQMIGTIGTAVGIIFAWFFLVRTGMWYLSIVMAFIVFLNIIQFIGIRQKYKGVVKIMKQSNADNEAIQCRRRRV